MHLLGQEIFDGFAQDHLDARPSRSPTLAGLSPGFADLGVQRQIALLPDIQLPRRSCEATWPGRSDR
uniref:DNA-binding domain-containing protein n=1 Tax=Streptomyces sp. NBC_00003 TaxID=2903608 RepID=A0AAU2UZ34_9ACTN